VALALVAAVAAPVRAKQASGPAREVPSAPAQRLEAASGARPVPTYRISAGDRLDVYVAGREQLSREALRVDARGLIRLPLLDESILASCQTEDELARAIEDRYREYLVTPQVSVSVREYGSQPVEVVGAVERPGLFQLQREVRLRELLSIAGGVKPSAGAYVQLAHDESVTACETLSDAGTLPITTSVRALEIAALLRGQTANPVVRPGDFVHIPEADQVFVVGQVVRPSALPLNQRLTVSKAIAMVGGRTADAKSQARIIRPRPNDTTNSDLLIDLKAIEQEGAPDVELQAGDVVEVPAAAGRQFLKVALTSLLQAAAYYPLWIIR
jgi:polysaccharide export outer membrane protein